MQYDEEREAQVRADAELARAIHMSQLEAPTPAPALAPPVPAGLRPAEVAARWRERAIARGAELRQRDGRTAGQARRLQSRARQPASHAHVLSARHVPWCEQSLVHLGAEQSSPVKRMSHVHVPLRHAPWPEQSFGQSFSSHAVPAQPGEHSHTLGAVHVPAWQPEAQTGVAHEMPV